MINNLLSSIKSLAEPVSWAIVHSLWQGALVAIVLTIALIILRNKKATIRYAVSCLALLGIIILFIGTVFYLSADARSSTGLALKDNIKNVPRAETVYEDSRNASYPLPRPAKTALPQLQKLAEEIPGIFQFWLLGVALITLYHFVGWNKTRRLIKAGTEPLSSKWQERVANLCEQMGIKYQIKIVQSTLAQMPCVIGFIKPVVLLPLRVFTGLSEDQLEMIIIHELAHVRHLDCLINYLQIAAETMLYFNPAVWWVSRQIRTERELCCDDLAVQISGKKLLYAKALVNLEEMRQIEPNLAMRIDGASPLLQRIQRLGGQTMPRNSSFAMLRFSGIIALLIMLTIGVNSINGYTEPNQLAYSESAEEDNEDSDSDKFRGRWKIERENDHFYVQLTFRMDKYKIVSGSYEEQLTDVISENNGVFSIKRDAGTFYLEGDIDIGDRQFAGSGKCTFKPDPKYITELKSMGFEMPDDDKILSMGVLDIDLAFVRGIHQTEYKNINLDRLIEFHIHDVTPEYIANLKKVGQESIPADKIVQMKIHDVEPEYIMKFQNLGYVNLKFDDLIRMSIHDVDPEYVKSFAAYGYDDIDIEGLIRMSIHDVDPGYIKSFEEYNLGHIEIEDLIRMSIHDVKPSYIKAFVDMGYDDLDVESLIQMSIHDVDPDYIKAFEAYDLGHIETEDLIRMSIHDVDPEFIKSYTELGFENLDIDELIQMSIHDISAEYISELAELGYSDIKAEELVQMSIHDVTPEFIRELQRREFKDLTPERLIRIKIHDLY